MLLLVAVLIILTVIALIPTVWVPATVKVTTLGWMSERWLAEHRASHQP